MNGVGCGASVGAKDDCGASVGEAVSASETAAELLSVSETAAVAVIAYYFKDLLLVSSYQLLYMHVMPASGYLSVL